jgi:hypothetical protein
MLEFIGRGHRTCDGVSRRTFLTVGSLALGGLTLPGLLRLRAAQKSSGSPRRSVILIWQAGGPSHLDMYDLKPNAPAEIRGEFKPISTNVPGIQIGEHLPRQAQIMDKLAILRSAYHTNAGHGMGSQWMLTGYQPTIEVNDNIYPSSGSVVARMRGANEPGLPAYVNLPRVLGLGKAAYLGASYNPFAPDSDPNSPGFQVRNLRLPGRVDASRLSRRRELLHDLDKIRRDIDTRGDISGLDTFYRDGLEMVTNTKAQRAFDIPREPDKLRERYGRNDLGQCCLLARRLVEAGVTFVTIQAGGGWDTHGDNFKQLKVNLLPKFDQAVAALVSDLYDRGLQGEVLVMAMGGIRPHAAHQPAGRPRPLAGSHVDPVRRRRPAHGPGHRHHECRRRVSHQQARHARLRAGHHVPLPGDRLPPRLLRSGPAAAAYPQRGRADRGLDRLKVTE